MMTRIEVEIFDAVVLHAVLLDSTIPHNATLAEIHRRVAVLWKRKKAEYFGREQRSDLTPRKTLAF